MRFKDFDELEEVREKAAELLSVDVEELELFAWEQTFANTTGPHGGLGGQALTKATVFVFKDFKGNYIAYCQGVFKKGKNFTPFKNIDF